MLGKVREIVYGLFVEQCKVGGVWFRMDPSGGLAIFGVFNCKRLVSEMELFFMIWMRRVPIFVGDGV